jgi:hypothetical protein
MLVIEGTHENDVLWPINCKVFMNWSLYSFPGAGNNVLQLFSMLLTMNTNLF